MQQKCDPNMHLPTTIQQENLFTTIPKAVFGMAQVGLGPCSLPQIRRLAMASELPSWFHGCYP